MAAFRYKYYIMQYICVQHNIRFSPTLPQWLAFLQSYVEKLDDGSAGNGYTGRWTEKAGLMVNSSHKEPAAAAARRKARLAREAELLEEGRADIRAGRCLSGDALETWLDRLDTAQEPSVPGRLSGRKSR